MDFLAELAQQLYERRHRAVVVPFRDCSGLDFQPTEQDCHANVGHWCRIHPEQEPVRGWLVIEHLDRGYCRFVAHSVVGDQNGRLLDLTPPGVAQRYPFLPHPYTGEEFLLLLSRRCLIHIDHRFRP